MLACVCQPTDTSRLFGAGGRAPGSLGAVPKPPRSVRAKATKHRNITSVHISSAAKHLAPSAAAITTPVPASASSSSAAVTTAKTPTTATAPPPPPPTNEQRRPQDGIKSLAASSAAPQHPNCAAEAAAAENGTKSAVHAGNRIPPLTITDAPAPTAPDQHHENELPDGVQLTLNELRDMAYRQQHQIESQHQLLAAKEQRLRFLKEQEARHQRVASENERLRRLRDRVEAQELKLRKLRALRGQVDQNKQNNALLTSDLDSIRALFNEKEKELSVAVAKVDELTRQLEDLRRGRASEPPSAAALELDKLRRELMYRNKLNEQQNARLYQQREALTQRQDEMTNIDKRISELQDRLHRKRVLNQQLANQITAASNKASHPIQVANPSMVSHPANNTPHNMKKQQSRGNIAAIEPYNHIPSATNDNHFSEKLQKTYFLPVISNQLKNNNMNQNDCTNYKNQKEDYNDMINNAKKNNTNQHLSSDLIAEFSASKSDPKYQTLPYNTKFSVNFLSSKNNRDPTVDGEKEKLSANEADTGHYTNNLKSGYQQHMTVHSTPLSTINKSLAVPLNQNENMPPSQDKSTAIGSKRNEQKSLLQMEQIHRLHSQISRGQPVGGPSSNTSSTSSLLTTSSQSSSNQKPVSSVAPTSLHHTPNKLSTIYQTSSTKIQPVQPQTIQSTLQASQSSSPHINHHQPPIMSPPTLTSTPLGTPDTSADKSPKPVLPPKPAIKPPPRQMQPTTDLDYKSKEPPPIPVTEPPHENTAAPVHTVIKSSYDNKPIKAKPLTIKKQPPGEQPRLRTVPKLNGVHVSINRRIEMPPAFLFPETDSPPSDLVTTQHEAAAKKPNLTNNNTIDLLAKSGAKPQDTVDKAAANDEKLLPTDLEDENRKNSSSDINAALDKIISMNINTDNVVRRVNKGNLKQSGKVNLSRRVSFDPLALLLDASLEGELELVKKTATQVTNASAANDEGITALHNAICAGHLEIVQFLVEFGCDVNAQDSDGWTPLHCAASCNNVAMVRFLVEHGACIFATTLSDHETAAEKCEEDEEGFDGCSEYLYSVQEKLGILCAGAVFAVFDYTAQQPDELSFEAGDQITVLRKGDENEREWWWARHGDREGYIPRNLLGLYPRVSPKSDQNGK